MNILLIGQADSIFFEHFSKGLRKAASQIFIEAFSIDDVKGKNDLSAFDNVHITSWSSTVISRVKGLRTILEPFYVTFCLYFFLVRNKKKYDVIHIKWVKASIVLSSYFVPQFTKKTIVMPWGGEFESQKILYSRKLYMFFFKRLLNKGDVITYATDEMKKKLSALLKEPPVMKFAIYGSNVIKQIQQKSIRYDRDVAKAQLGINVEKITVTVGYSGKTIHQHKQVLYSLLENEEFVSKKNQFVFLIPMSYGGNIEYRMAVENILIQNRLNYRIFSDKMSDSGIASIRLASDIFVQVTLFDNRSASVIEYILAGAVMISGSWLPYEVFKNRGLYFHEVDNLHDSTFSELFMGITDRISEESKKSITNREKWGFNETWERVMPNWISIYKQ